MAKLCYLIKKIKNSKQEEKIMKQCNLLSEKDNEQFRKAYQSPLCKLKLFDETDDVLTSSGETPIEWIEDWDGFLTGTQVD
jgi:hypothetical protein